MNGESDRARSPMDAMAASTAHEKGAGGATEPPRDAPPGFFSRRFPEVARYSMAELRRPRLLLAAGISVLVGLALSIIAQAPGGKDGGAVIYWVGFVVEALALCIYGTVRVTGSVLVERAQGTWDLQRLTPQSAFELAFGKLVGAPVFAFYVALLTAPWQLLAVLGSPSIHPGTAMAAQVLLLSFAALSMCMGLLISSSTLVVSSHSSFASAGSVTGVTVLTGFLVCLPYLFRIQTVVPKVTYFGLTLPVSAMAAVSAVVFAIWAFFAALWQIADDLLEQAKGPRIPLFFLFLFVYISGFGDKAYPAIFIVPAGFVYFIGFLRREQADRFRQWLVPTVAYSEAAQPSASAATQAAVAQDGSPPALVLGAAPPRDDGASRPALDGAGKSAGVLARARLTPAWIQAALSYAFLIATCLAMSLLFRPQAGRSDDSSSFVYAWQQLGFLVRDLCILQACRFTRSRQPELMAMALLIVVYAVPASLLLAFHEKAMVHWALPFVPAGVSPSFAVVPALLQAAVGALLLALAVRKRVLRSIVDGYRGEVRA